MQKNNNPHDRRMSASDFEFNLNKNRVGEDKPILTKIMAYPMILPTIFGAFLD